MALAQQVTAIAAHKVALPALHLIGLPIRGDERPFGVSILAAASGVIGTCGNSTGTDPATGRSRNTTTWRRSDRLPDSCASVK